MKYSLLLYIDPATGAMLFTALIRIVSTVVFAFQKFLLKLKFFVLNGHIDKALEEDKSDLVIFSDHKRYWNVFKPICDELEKRKISCKFWTASEDDPALEEEYEYVSCSFIGAGNKAYAVLNMMRAYICLATTPGLDVYQWKRSKHTDYYIHTFHSPSVPLYRMFGLDFYDAVLLNGSFQEDMLRKLEKLRNLPAKEMPIVGSTYLDAMEERYASMEVEKINKTTDNITVLLAPSWGKSAILTKYGRRFLEALKATGYNIIVRPHPQSLTAEKKLLEELKKEFPNSERWEWNFDNDNYYVLARADIMISDFSGIILDNAFIFDGAVIYTDTNFDPSPYDIWWLNEPLWIETVLPQIGKQLIEEDIENLKNVISETINSETYKKGREEIKNIAWEYKGKAAELTVDYIVNKLAEVKAQT
ncbi:MAG: CDP-glycerol glycerophosphotransferase family protein [Lachnospiraceae bacterium]|nr:CDP-glycerol glycerophosphotransferase family protein [Lachnospiraceae bacterium]